MLDVLAGVARVFVGPGDDPAVGERLDEAARVPLAGVLAGLGVHGLNTHARLERAGSELGEVKLNVERGQDDARVVLRVYGFVVAGLE